MSCRCLIMAGGTGGHIFPALAVAECLEHRGCEIYWLGSFHGLEVQLVPKRYHLHLLPIKGWRRARFVDKLCLPWRLLWSVFRAWRVMRRINPDVVLGMGGYVSAPGGMAARLLGKRLIIHEQNAKAGLTNRLLAKLAHQRLQAFEGALPRAMTTGNPIRSSLLTISPHQSQESLHVLVLGGSQGARPINHAVQQCLTEYPVLAQSFQFWHQSGEADHVGLKTAYEGLSSSVRLDSFIDDMSAAYAWADLVICRAGAMTVSEIAVVGIASILVPYPFAADNHQYFNALSLSQRNAAILLPQAEMTAASLYRLLNAFATERGRLRAMAQAAKQAGSADAADVVAALVQRCAI